MSHKPHRHGRAYQAYDVSSLGYRFRTFQGDKYEVRGIWALRKDGKRDLVADLYEDIRTVKNEEFQTIAKRENRGELLQKR